MENWPHQDRAIYQIRLAIDEGYKRILVAGPTGSGKGLVIEKTIEMGAKGGATLYTNRRLLFDQTGKRLTAAGFEWGARASGHEVNPLQAIQLAMVQTEGSRVLQGQTREHHKSGLVIIDEAHQHTGDTVCELRKRHEADGATVVGFTATPLDLGGHYDKLIVMATNTECRKCGAHVPAVTYAPDEPDLHHVRRAATGEFETKALRSLFMRPVIFGRVAEHWYKLEGQHRPTLLFGPDVAGSRWFCEEFNRAGIPAGHIDHEEVIIGTEVMPNSDEARQRLIESLISGELKIVCNRFILREGIDIPQVGHMIFATAFGSLTSYLQAGGRGLRSCPSMDKKNVTVQDHGGNWHRHGSLNADRIWELGQGDLATVREREDKLREKSDPKVQEPIVCPECSAVRNSGSTCSACGHTQTKPSRMVIQLDGSLRECRGDIYRARQVSTATDGEKKWIGCYFRGKNSGMTFSQVFNLFRRENGWQDPNPNWPYMPRDKQDMYLKVCDVKNVTRPAPKPQEPEPVDSTGLFIEEDKPL